MLSRRTSTARVRFGARRVAESGRRANPGLIIRDGDDVVVDDDVEVAEEEGPQPTHARPSIHFIDKEVRTCR